MATKFLETSQATFGLHFWDTDGGSVTRDVTAARDPLGLSSWKCDSDGASTVAYVQKGSIFPIGANEGGRVSFYLYLADLPIITIPIAICGYPANYGIGVRISSSGVLKLYDEDLETQIGSDGSALSTGTLYRLSVAYTLNASAQISDVKVFLDGIQDISVTGQTVNISTGHAWLGWCESGAGTNKVFNFSHVFVDDDTSLTDPAGINDLYITAKLPDELNDDNYDTTGGTGAVNERPLSETNYKMHAAKSQVLQDYTLQTAAEGDVDISGETLVARCAWMWAMSSKDGDIVYIVDNGDSTTGWPDIDGVPQICAKITDSAVYPSNAAGIGQKSGPLAPDEYLYECGTLIAYTVAAEEGIVKVMGSTVGLSEAAVGRRRSVRLVPETVGLSGSCKAQPHQGRCNRNCGPRRDSVEAHVVGSLDGRD